MQFLRLKKKKEFSAVLKSGKRAYQSSLTVVYLRSKQTKMAVCVGKKYGKSVQRNRIKRLLREAFRAQEQTQPCIFLLIPKVAEEYSVETFRRDIAKILKKEKLVET